MIIADNFQSRENTNFIFNPNSNANHFRHDRCIPVFVSGLVILIITIIIIVVIIAIIIIKFISQYTHMNVLLGECMNAAIPTTIVSKRFINELVRVAFVRSGECLFSSLAIPETRIEV